MLYRLLAGKTLGWRLGSAYSLFVLLFLSLFPARVEAQVLYGSLVGNVRDQTGGAIPGADLTILHVETDLTRHGVTNEVGGYAFPSVRTGTYTIRVSMPGFREFVQSNVPVTLNSVVRVDVVLEVGELAQRVTVTAVAPLLQTDRAEVRAEVTSEKLVNLPLPLGRNYQQLFKTLPGFTPPREAHSIQTNPSRSLVFNVNGVSDSINNTRIDGATSSNPQLPHITAYVPSLESIQTVNVVTNSFDAEQGLAGGAAINVQLKSGTNEFRGSAFGYHHNNRLRARNFFWPQGVAKPKTIYNQWGGTLGGPIRRDRLFFFASYEGTSDRRTASSILSVPTRHVRDGDFSRFNLKIYDPLTGKPDGSGRLPFPGNRIPPERRDLIVEKIIRLIPMPNLNQNETNNYFKSAPFLFDRHILDTKVDWNASDRLNVFGRFSILAYDVIQPTAFGRELEGPILRTTGAGSGNAGTGTGNTYNFSIGGTYIFSPNFLVDGNFGFVQGITDSRHPSYADKVGLDLLGIPGTNGPNPWEGGWPRFDIGGYALLGTQEDFMPYYRSDPQNQYVGNFSWTKKTHEIRWGWDLYYQHMNHTQPQFSGGAGVGPRGRFIFGEGPTRLCERPDGRGGCSRLSPSVAQINSFATFLLGLPTRLGKNLADLPFTTRTRNYSFYVRDRWQVRPKLTLSYGIRWEYFPIPTRANRGLERYDWDTDRMHIGGVGVVPEDFGIRVSRTLFAPRLGLAYRVKDRFVVRAGYGITNDPFPMIRRLRSNYPTIIELVNDGPNSWTPAGRLRDGIPSIKLPDLGNGVIPVPSNYTVNTFSPTRFNRGYIQSWNLTLQHELRWDFVGEVGYVATRSIRQLGHRELNWAPLGTGRAGQQLFQKFLRTAQTALLEPFGGSHYDSLQARLQRRFADGYSVDAAYTWSKSITNSGATRSDSDLDIPIPAYYHLNRQISQFDRTHNLEITHITELPFGRGKRWLNGDGVLAVLAGGWQVNGILSFMSGTPFGIRASATPLNSFRVSQRADQVKPNVQILGGVGPGQPYFDPLAFAPVNEPRLGNSSFSALRGPGLANWDFGLFRSFRISEEMKIEFRMEVLNFTNTPKFPNPGDNVSNLRLNPDGTVANLNGFSEIRTASGEREFRFGLRIEF